MSHPTDADPTPVTKFLWSMLGLTAWVAVGIVYSVIGWGVIGLMIRLTGMGPWGWLAAAVVAVASLVGSAATAFSYLWYLTIMPDSLSGLVRHMRRHPGPATIAVAVFALIVAVVVVAGLLWLQWESTWRWVALGALSTMLVSNGFSNGVIEGEQPTRR